MQAVAGRPPPLPLPTPFWPFGRGGLTAAVVEFRDAEPEKFGSDCAVSGGCGAECEELDSVESRRGLSVNSIFCLNLRSVNL
ncbi:hypothetical protein BT69DRAFT_1276816 [Atractiella rhizophila]|nr:hypothetical protein BT69DRAFT_1276816 [Atractiella rhizophila]